MRYCAGEVPWIADSVRVTCRLISRPRAAICASYVSLPAMTALTWAGLIEWQTITTPIVV